MFTWRATAFVNFTHKIGFRKSGLFRKIDEDFGGSISWNTQPKLSCIWWSAPNQVRDSTHDGCHALQRVAPFYRDFRHGSQQVATFYRAGHVILLQHGYCTFVIILFRPFARLFVIPNSATTLGLVEQAFWRVPLFTEWIGASSFKVILAGPSRHSATGTSCFWDFGFSTHFSHSGVWKNSEKDSAVSILHAYWYRDGNCDCLL